MNRQESLRRRDGEPFDLWTYTNETELQQAIEDGNEASMRSWQGKRYGAVA